MEVRRMVCVVVAVVVCVCAETAWGQLSWRRIDPVGGVAPAARKDAALEYDPGTGVLIMFGGVGPAGELNDVWTFDVATGVWTERVANGAVGSPQPRLDMVSGVAGSSFYVSSGQRGSTVFADVWRLDLLTYTWTQLPQAGKIPRGRYGSAGGVHPSGTGLYLSHGFDKKVRFDDTFFYSFAGQAWHEVTPAGDKPAARCLVGTTMVAPDAFVMFGGCGSGGYSRCPSQDAYIFGANFADGSRNWVKVDKCPPKVQRSAMAPFPGNAGKAILFGGKEDKSDAAVNVLDLAARKWARVVPLGSPRPAARAEHAMALVSTATPFVAVFGGRVGGSETNELWALDGTTEAGLPVLECEIGFDFRILHGLCMWLAWGIMLPGGILWARFAKYVDKKIADKPIWFFVHRIIMPTGLIVALLGFIFAFFITKKHFTAVPHAYFGLMVMALGLAQPIIAFVRPHADPFRKSRMIWQYIHWWVGRTAAFFGLINIGLGVWHVDRYDFKSVTFLWVLYGLMIAAYVISFPVFNVLRGRNDADSKQWPSWHVWVPLIQRKLD